MTRLVPALLACALGACSTAAPYDYEDAPPPRTSRPERPGHAQQPNRPDGRPIRPGQEAEAERCQRYLPLARAIADEHGLDWAIIAGIAAIESRWTPEARSRAGARGLMQIMPSTGKRLRCGDLSDAESNLRCGARLLDRLLGRYDGDVVYALSAYAIGAKLPDRAYARRAPPPRERFIERVLAGARRFRDQGCH